MSHRAAPGSDPIPSEAPQQSQAAPEGAAPDQDRILPPEAPTELETAAHELRRANQELTALVHQVALWRALAYDRALAERLGRSYAAQGFLTARSAILNGVVLSISRMFDGTRTSLDLNATFNRILKPSSAAWLRARRASDLLDVPAVDGHGRTWTKDEAAVLHRMAERDAEEAGPHFDEELEAFKHAKKRFTGGDAGEALKRLQELRNKEIAHHDLNPAWATPRPTLADLDLVFAALADLLARANTLCTGLDINTEAFERSAALAARCFAAGLRAETPEERRAARSAGPQPAERP